MCFTRDVQYCLYVCVYCTGAGRVLLVHVCVVRSRCRSSTACTCVCVCVLYGTGAGRVLPVHVCCTVQVLVEFPDGRPAALEPMSVCVANTCRNLSTDARGRLTYTVPPHLLTGTPTVATPHRHSHRI